MNIINCPKCGYENKNTNIKCERCGEQLAIEDEMQEIDLYSSYNAQKEVINDVNISRFINIFFGLLLIFLGIIFCSLPLAVIFYDVNSFVKIIFLLFFICGVAVLFRGISMIYFSIYMKKNINAILNGIIDNNIIEEKMLVFDKILTNFHNIFLIVFFAFWFGALIRFDIHVIKTWSNDSVSILLFSLIFWFAGIGILINNIKKRK